MNDTHASVNASNYASVSVYDHRPFFEKALRFGLSNRLIDAATLEAIRTDAPKGMVQIARYFGSEFLRPELEKSRERLVNLISLHLEQNTGGDLHQAATLLRDHSLLSRSKAGSEMLKALLSMPDNSHFSMIDSAGFRDELIPVLARWSLRTLPDYQQELAHRTAIQNRIEAAFWLAEHLGVSRRDLQAMDTDADAVIRTGLLAQAAGLALMPQWAQFAGAVKKLRKQAAKPATRATGKARTSILKLSLPKNLPAEFAPVLQAALASMAEQDLPKILDLSIEPRKLFAQSLNFMGRYFWLDDEGIEDVSALDRALSDQWLKLTQNHTDDSSLITLFLCIAVGVPPKSTLTESAAASVVRKLRKGHFDATLAGAFIHEYAPHEHHNDYQTLWTQFVLEAERDLKDERDTKLAEAMTVLRLHCNVVKASLKTAKASAKAVR